MQSSRWSGVLLLLCCVAFAQADSLYYSQNGLLYRYDTVTNTVGPAFGAGYQVDQNVGFQTAGLEVGPDGTVYAEAMVGGSTGIHMFQKFNGPTGTYLGGIEDPTLGNESPTMGPDKMLYMSASLYIPNGGGVDNGLMRIDPNTGVNCGNLIQPGFNTNLLSIPIPLWLPNGNLLVTDGDNQTIKQFNPITGAYEGVFASITGDDLGSLAYANGVVYASDYRDQQVLKFNSTTGAFLGDLFTGPLNGFVGRIEISDGELFADQTNITNYNVSHNIYRYNLATGAFEMQLNLGGSVDNFAMASQVQVAPEAAPLLGLGLGVLALARRVKRKSN